MSIYSSTSTTSTMEHHHLQFLYRTTPLISRPALFPMAPSVPQPPHFPTAHPQLATTSTPNPPRQARPPPFAP
ncbi:unnamed protein product [Chondrus crispus]|uniref:Uncharacterized protein n=1 Tax=Chondrus crispus TaxID=2769 RepID=R7QPN3_CHOCR|nr:unnamed protein product [Chondrus crispus]CDF40044.1 unnamed protein product [Chondrus crispus]|eukprot:XP_005710338.1 unnamed protein product [Chondrus crispus]